MEKWKVRLVCIHFSSRKLPQQYWRYLLVAVSGQIWLSSDCGLWVLSSPCQPAGTCRCVSSVRCLLLQVRMIGSVLTPTILAQLLMKLLAFHENGISIRGRIWASGFSVQPDKSIPYSLQTPFHALNSPAHCYNNASLQFKLVCLTLFESGHSRVW